MSRGLPVAVTMVGGLVEAAGEYEGVRFVRPGDVADLRQALLDLPAMAGRRYADPHSWDRSVKRLDGLVAAIGNAHRAAPLPHGGDVWSGFAAGEVAVGESSDRPRQAQAALRGAARD